MSDAGVSQTEERLCLVCSKPGTELPNGLKRCSRCQKATYCSKECQTSHWPTHKSACSLPKSSLPPPHPQLKLFFSDQKYCSTELKTYQMLIDTFRLRCEDDYTWGQHNHGVYGNDPPLPVFKDFLARAKTVGMLPKWWNEEKAKDCEKMATDDEHFNINFAVEKSDIQEYYKDNMMPMTLRMVAENVYGGGYGLGQRPMPEGYQCQC